MAHPMVRRMICSVSSGNGDGNRNRREPKSASWSSYASWFISSSCIRSDRCFLTIRLNRDLSVLIGSEYLGARGLEAADHVGSGVAKTVAAAATDHRDLRAPRGEEVGGS